MQLTTVTAPRLATAPALPEVEAPEATTPAPVDNTFPPKGLPGGAWFRDRPGGENAKPADNAVAQVVIQFPMNFMATALQDVRMGTVLETHASLEDARQGARALAVGRTSLGVVRQLDGKFGVAELLLFDNDQMGIDPTFHKDMPLAFGPDPARTRIVQSVHLLKEAGERPTLEGLWIRGGNTYIQFDANGDGNVSFNHA
jgi:hypothetical protein